MFSAERERAPLEPERPWRAEWLWFATLAGLSVVTACLYSYPALHLMSVASFNYSEGWNAYWQLAALAGTPLYAKPPDLNIVNYPPASFHLIGLLSRVLGDVNVTGRIVALLSVVWAACNIATATAYITRSRRSGVYGALCFLLWLVMLTPGRVATNDPNFLGLALSTLGVCAYLRAKGRDGWLIAAATFFTAALFVKNNLLAFPAATLVHLLFMRRLRPIVVFAGAGAIVAGIFLALTFAVDGPDFFSNLLAARSFSRLDGLSSIAAFYERFYVPVLLGIGWLFWSIGPARSLLALYFSLAALLSAAFAFGNGVAYNIHYETLAALAIMTAFVVSVVRRSVAVMPRGQVPAALFALLPVFGVLVWAPSELYGVLGRSARLPQREADFAAGVAFIGARPGSALCESLLMCFKAGKPFIYDSYYVKDQIKVGRIPESRIVSALNDRVYQTVEIGEDDAGFSVGEGERLRFTAKIMAALLANYQVVQRSPTSAIMVPR